MAKVTIKQHDITDCGAACLASISSYFSLYLPIAGIQQYTGTDNWKSIILTSFHLQVSISIAVLTNNEVPQISGGSYFLKSNLLVAS